MVLCECKNIFLICFRRFASILKVNRNIVIDFEGASRSFPVNFEGIYCRKLFMFSDLIQDSTMVEMFFCDFHIPLVLVINNILIQTNEHLVYIFLA